MINSLSNLRTQLVFSQNGHVYLVDRKKELIKVKGLQVAPAESENLIRSMAGVLDVAVIGIEDELRKESDDFKLDS